MKKRVVLVMLALTMCVLTACGDNATDVANKDDVVKDEIVDDESDAKDAEETVVEGDISSEFKKEVDDYEKYFFEYVEVMKLYMEAAENNDLKEMDAIREENEDLFDKYPKAMGDYMDIADRDLTDDEQAYFQAASKRITEKLREVVPKNEEEE